jgi:hypothetical protein
VDGEKITAQKMEMPGVGGAVGVVCCASFPDINHIYNNRKN